MLKRNCVIFLLYCLALTLPASAQQGASQRPSAPDARDAQNITPVGDWELVCDPATEATTPSGESNRDAKVVQPHCKATQRQAVKDTGETVFMASVLTAAQPGKQVMIISTPLGGYLAPGMELLINKKRKVRLLYETCNAGGCHGGFALSGALRDELLVAKTLAVRLWTAKGKAVSVNISMNGFARAVKTLEERSR